MMPSSKRTASRRFLQGTQVGAPSYAPADAFGLNSFLLADAATLVAACTRTRRCLELVVELHSLTDNQISQLVQDANLSRKYENGCVKLR